MTDKDYREQLNKHLEDFLKLYQGSELTKKNYRSDLNQFIEFLVDLDKPLEELTTYDISLYNDKLTEKNYKPATHNRKHASMNMFLEYLKDIDIIKRNVKNIIPPRSNKPRESRFIDSKELDQLLAYINRPSMDELECRNRLIMKSLLALGLRMRELINVNIDDFKNKQLEVIGKGNKQRKVPVPDNLIKDINRYLMIKGVENKGALFTTINGDRISVSGMNKIINTELDKAGLGGIGITPHSFRHTYATELDRNLVSVGTIQSLLGHSNREMTEHYIHTTSREKTEAGDIVNNILW